MLLLAALLSEVPGVAAAAQREPAPVPPGVSCGALQDATGAKVNGQTGGGPVGTSSPRRCPAAKRPAKQAPPVQHAAQPDGVPDLSAAASARRTGAQSGPLRFAAENPERVGGALVTGGAMIWALHSGLLTSVLLLGVPLWRHVDLLPIVACNYEDTTRKAGPNQEEAAVAQVLETGNGQSLGAPGPA